MKRKILTIATITIAIIALIILFAIKFPVIGLFTHEYTRIVSVDESHTVLYVSFDDDFDVSDKGRIAGIVKDKYNSYIAYYVKGDATHEYLYANSCFYKKYKMSSNVEGFYDRKSGD